MGRFNVVAGIIFWHKDDKVAVVLNLQVSLVGFQQFCLFCVNGNGPVLLLLNPLKKYCVFAKVLNSSFSA